MHLIKGCCLDFEMLLENYHLFFDIYQTIDFVKDRAKQIAAKSAPTEFFDFILPSKFSKIVQNLPGYNKILSTYKPKQITSCCF